MSNTDRPNIHQGRNIKRFREMLGLKQEALAYALGDEWSQKRVSLLEAKDVIEDDILAQVAAILKVPVEAIKNFDEQAAVTYFNTFNDTSVNHGAFMGHNSTYNFNPIEKWLEIIEENKKLSERAGQSAANKTTTYNRLRGADQKSVLRGLQDEPRNKTGLQERIRQGGLSNGGTVEQHEQQSGKHGAEPTADHAQRRATSYAGQTGGHKVDNPNLSDSSLIGDLLGVNHYAGDVDMAAVNEFKQRKRKKRKGHRLG